MFLFLKLVLAHLIADFILQFEELYRLKVRSHLGHFFHALIHGLVSLALAVPFIRAYPWIAVYLIALAVIHHYQDILKYSIQAKHPKQIFWCFTVDQIFHFLFIATSLLLPVSTQTLGFPETPALNFIYTSHWITLFLIAFITSIFKSTYFLHAIRKSFVPNSRPLHFITSFEVWHALLERGWITAWVLFAPPALGFSIAALIGFIRFFSPKLRSSLDFAMSYGYAALIGFLFRPWMGSLL